MAIRITYNDLNDMDIKSIKMDIEDDRFKVLRPIEKKSIIDGQELVEKLIQIKTVDERMMYELVQEIDARELRELIKALQLLAKQIINK